MQAGVGLLILDVMPMWWTLPGYRHDYLKFYQLPNSNLFTHRLLFFLERSHCETYDPRVSFSYYLTSRSILFPFISRSIKLNIQKYLVVFYFRLFYLAFDLSIYYNF